MEAKFSPKAVFIFLLGSSSLLIGITLWFFSELLFNDYKDYQIVFPSSVAGLYVGSSVTYNGMQVGTVSNIEINDKFGNKIIALISIESKIKIKEDTFATLNMKGITGHMFIELNGGSARSPIVKTSAKQIYIIPYKESTLTAITQAAPIIVNDLHKLLLKFSGIFNQKNQQNLENIINNINSFTKAANNLPSELSSAIKNINALLLSLKPLLEEAKTQINKLPNAVNQNYEKIKPFFKNLDNLAKNAEEITYKVNNYGIFSLINSQSL